LNPLNKFFLEGNLTKDPAYRSTPGGTLICNFSIAVNRYYGKGDDKEQETSFFDVEAWGEIAEYCQTYAKKGRGVRVYGRLKQERWNNAEGKQQSRILLVAKEIEYKPEKHKEAVQN